jgi:hypothetical protein
LKPDASYPFLHEKENQLNFSFTKSFVQGFTNTAVSYPEFANNPLTFYILSCFCPEVGQFCFSAKAGH